MQTAGNPLTRIRKELARFVRRLQGRKQIPPSEAMLEMVWPVARLGDLPAFVVPRGFTLRTYRSGDDAGFVDLMARAEYPGWDAQQLLGWLGRVVPGGLFLLVDDATGNLVGTAMACHNPAPRHPFGGTLSSVAVDTAWRGRGLGYVVAAAATTRLLQGQYVDVYMQTDDWRLPAIKTYIKMGWVPLLYRADMSARWEGVYRQLGLPFAPELWPGSS